MGERRGEGTCGPVGPRAHVSDAVHKGKAFRFIVYSSILFCSVLFKRLCVCKFLNAFISTTGIQGPMKARKKKKALDLLELKL